MKKTLITIVLIALLAGCQSNQQLALKDALGNVLIIGAEVEKAERIECGVFKIYDMNGVDITKPCPTADSIKVWLDAGQKIYDTGSYADNCELMLSVTDIAYDWLADKYPDKIEYRIAIAVLRSKLDAICGEKP